MPTSGRPPRETGSRQTALAERTERSKAFSIREAASRPVEDMEEYSMAVEAYEDFLASGEEAIPLDVLKASLGLEGCVHGPGGEDICQTGQEGGSAHSSRPAGKGGP